MIARARRTTFVACAVHALHDGMIDGLLVFLPIFQAQFGLSFAAVGLLRATATGVMAAGQAPASALAGRIGGRATLAFGTGLAGLGYLAAGASGGLLSVLAALALIGLGASVQHPVASEAVAAAHAGAGRRMALGVYNFAGDLGKTALPPLAALFVAGADWRVATAVVGALALAGAAAVAPALPKDAPAQDDEQDAGGAAGPGPFRILVVIGLLDGATRMAFLTFLPFLIAARGGAIETTGLALSLLFFGGACGKFACGWLSARIGPVATVVVTELLTAACVAGAALLPLWPLLVLMAPLGVALNGTSSALYGSVADLAPAAGRRRAFAIFYTATVGSGAIAPVFAGLASDRAGLGVMLGATACLALAVAPLALALRPALQAPLSGANTSPSR